MSTPTSGIVISPIAAGFERWERLLDVIRASFAYMDGHIDPPSSVHRLTLARLREKAAAEAGFVAWVDDDIAGCVFIAEQADHFYVGKLAVAPSHQGKGCGRRLMEAAESHARRNDKPLLELQTRVELIDNQRLFSTLGFVETQRTAHDGYDRPTSVTMRKVLA